MAVPLRRFSSRNNSQHGRLGDRIERAGGFVGEEDGRVMHYGKGDEKALTLTGAEFSRAAGEESRLEG